MSEKIVFANEEIIDSISFFIFLIIGGIIFITNSFFSDETMSNKIIEALIIGFIVSVGRISKTVFIKNEKITRGISFLFFLKFESFSINDIADIFINQNDENYFEITVKRKYSSNFIIKKLPNKNPALAELKLIKDYIELAKNQKLN